MRPGLAPEGQIRLQHTLDLVEDITIYSDEKTPLEKYDKIKMTSLNLVKTVAIAYLTGT